jgi:hypothetical protein
MMLVRPQGIFGVKIRKKKRAVPKDIAEKPVIK